MAISARRMRRQQASPVVVLYSGVNYTGLKFALDSLSSYSRLESMSNIIRSVKLLSPAKVYLYEDEDFSGAQLVLTESVPDLGVYYYQSDWPFAQTISSLKVRPADYNFPLQPAGTPIIFSDLFSLPVLETSQQYSNANISQITYDIQHTVTYDTFMTNMGAISASQTTNDNRIMTILNQIIRNTCAQLYRSPDQQPARYPLTALHFVESTDYYAWATPASSDIFITSRLNIMPPSFVVAALAHELSHTYGHNKYYGQPGQEKVSGTCEGIAMHNMFDYGFNAMLPTDGGVNWYDGYETTALFFDYIVNHSPAPESDFIHELNMTMNPADPAIGKAYWSDSVITSLNSRGLTVDQLWAEYKTWLAN